MLSHFEELGKAHQLEVLGIVIVGCQCYNIITQKRKESSTFVDAVFS